MKKVLLIIKDGWGYSPETTGNAVRAAQTPFYDSLVEKYPFALIEAAGCAVGLPEGNQGNSEVGHSTIGAGRVLKQSLLLINQSIQDGTFYENTAFIKSIKHAQNHQTSLHLIGLLQEEGVHAHINHLFALLDLCQKENFSNVLIHIMTDGRDSLPTHSLVLVEKLESKLQKLGFGSIVSISGRYWGMDRNQDWQITEQATLAIRDGISDKHYTDPLSSIKKSHQEGETDEFLHPRCRQDYAGMEDNASVIFWNFRTDRARQITQSFLEQSCPINHTVPRPVHFVAMTEYYDTLKNRADIAFPEQIVNQTLSEVISKAGMKQLKIAETVKYAHVTFFFNNGIEQAWNNESRILVETPSLESYADIPEMHAEDITEQAIKHIEQQHPDLVVLNYANPDMVGHSGDFTATQKAIEFTDACSEKLTQYARQQNYITIITADHGNVEDMTGEHKNSHTANQVPLHIITPQNMSPIRLHKKGGLADVAPTILDIIGLEVPSLMTGKTLIDHNSSE